MTVYVGIDPSTKTGLVRLQQDLCTESDWVNYPKLTGIERAVTIGESVRSFIESQKPRIAVIEGYSFGHSSSMSVNMEVGTAIRIAILATGTLLFEVSPQGLKKFVTGTGGGKKDVVRLGVYKKWGFEHAKDDVVDAYALAQVAKALDTDESKLLQYENDVLKKVKRVI